MRVHDVSVDGINSISLSSYHLQIVPLFHESKERLMVKLAEQARKGQETETVEYVGCMCCDFRVAVICVYIGVHITHTTKHS